MGKEMNNNPSKMTGQLNMNSFYKNPMLESSSSTLCTSIHGSHVKTKACLSFLTIIHFNLQTQHKDGSPGNQSTLKCVFNPMPTHSRNSSILRIKIKHVLSYTLS